MDCADRLSLARPSRDALLIFPNRQFRHAAIYINTASGISQPRDLAGKRIGEFAVYGHDAGVWPKGILSDEYGVKPEQSRWIVGRLDWEMAPINFIPRPHPSNVDVVAAHDADHGAMLDRSKIDALISANVPKCFLEGSPRVSRLFVDHKASEVDYFRRTGIFPIKHVVVIRKELLVRHPALARTVYDAFCAAKDTTMTQYKHGQIFNNMATMVSWISPLIGEARKLLGEDWWHMGCRRTARRWTLFCVITSSKAFPDD